jgi:membrane protein
MVEHDGIEFAGYLTFLSLLALFPFLVLIVAIAGFIGQGELGTRFIELMFAYLPEDAANTIYPRVQEIISGPPQGLLTIAILGAIWTSSSAVEGIRSVLNRAYCVSNPPTYVFRRAMSILQIILFTFVIILVMFLLVVPPLAIAKLQLWWGLEIDPAFAQQWSEWVIYMGMLLLLLMVASLYYFLPNIKQNLAATLPGAVLVVSLWVVGAYGFSIYISNVEQMNIIYGSLGGFIATMLFFFLMNVIFIFGAEFNYQVATRIGAKVEEKEHLAADAPHKDVHLRD